MGASLSPGNDNRPPPLSPLRQDRLGLCGASRKALGWPAGVWMRRFRRAVPSLQSYRSRKIPSRSDTMADQPAWDFVRLTGRPFAAGVSQKVCEVRSFVPDRQKPRCYKPQKKREGGQGQMARASVLEDASQGGSSPMASRAPSPYRSRPQVPNKKGDESREGLRRLARGCCRGG